MLLVAVSPFFIFALVMLHKRRDFQPLKSRSVTLIQTSTFGNFLFFVLVLAGKIIDNNYWQAWDYLGIPNKTSHQLILSSC